ncbi:hypothetical protein [Lactococcus lactis]|nr:hypothetical protein [Lactococcus lactis]
MGEGQQEAQASETDDDLLQMMNNLAAGGADVDETLLQLSGL